MPAAVCDLAKPNANFSICGRHIDEIGLTGLKRREERLPQVSVESLNLAFRLRAIRRARLDR